MTLRVEFTLETFMPGSSGPHVRAVIDAAAVHGLVVQLGPSGISGEGDDADVAPAVEAAIRAALEAGATRVSVQLRRAN